MELIKIMRGMLHNQNGLTEKISLSYAQIWPPVVVLESSQPQNSDTLRVERYVAHTRKEVEFRSVL